MTAPHSHPSEPALAAPSLGEAAVALARRWVDESADAPVDPAAARLAGVLKDPDGLGFTVGFVDGVARPEDLAVAAKNLKRLAERVPHFLPPALRAAVVTGGAVGEVLPLAVVPLARRVLRAMVGHLIVDSRPSKFGPAVKKLREAGEGAVRLNINLLGEAVLGDAEAANRLNGTKKLLQRPDVDYVSVKVSSVAAQLSMWAFDETVERVAQTLIPLYRIAARKSPLGLEIENGLPDRTFINLDMEEYRDLDLTIAVFQRILDEPDFLDLEAGIVLQAYLPDALPALQRLHAWAAERRARGGAPIKVRVVKGANLAMEHVDAALHGWPLATFDTKQQTDTNYKRVLDWALRPEHVGAVRIGVAGHNLFDLAWAWLLAEQRGVTEAVDVEMLLGMATGQAEAVRKTVGSLLLYTPVVAPKEFDVAIGYLVRRLEENASDANFMSSLFDLASTPSAFAKERDRFLASLAALEAELSAPPAEGGVGRDGGAGGAGADHHEHGDGAVHEQVDGDGGSSGDGGAGDDYEEGQGQDPGDGDGGASGGRSLSALEREAAEALREALAELEAEQARQVSLAELRGEPEGDEPDAGVEGGIQPGAEGVVPAGSVGGVHHGAEGVVTADAGGVVHAVAEAGARPWPEPWDSAGAELGPRRTQNRLTGDLEPAAAEFRNTPDTDTSLAANRAWGARILARVAGSTLGTETIESARVDDEVQLDGIVAAAVAAGERWGARSAAERAGYIRRAGYALEANRDRLIEVMAAETGKTIDQADPEVSEAIDFARYYAHTALELDTVEGAVFVPSRLTVVVPPWNFPVAIPAGGVLAALAAGSAVIIKPAPQARRSAAVMVEALWESGIPRELLTLVDVDEGDLGRQLMSDERVDRLILTGSYDTAALFRSWRPTLPLLAETSGKNAIVVTPSADLDLAVADLVSSAFGHAGQKCSAASLVILVGSVARSERFRRQLVDAVTSLTVGWPTDPASRMGPLIEPASGKLAEALTTLGQGERWLVEPKQLEGSGRLWSPGVREGVLPGSDFHLIEYFGPVLGILHATSLEQAIELQNAVPYGLTAGLHSLDSDEVRQWLATVEAGNLYVNRGTTGAIVRRQPFGGWKKSSVGAGAKAGGPNYLVHLGDWRAEPGEPGEGPNLAGLEPAVVQLLESATAGLDWTDFDFARRGAKSDQAALTSFFAPSDPSALEVERNVLRYLPVPVAVRLSEGRPLHELVRVLAAATLARAKVSVSSASKLPRPLRVLLKERGVKVVIENDAAWLKRAPQFVGQVPRIRLIGGDAGALAVALDGSPELAVHAGEVTLAGRLELLPFLREQAVSATDHRFGNPTPLLDGVL
ncbi:bifunctional proline dehydrogenase/L-glutamate gamma-semialdehyde dehydrogenase [Herbiconiux sp. CPCC 205716]|uniref:L-glutamate gamma-semialdehyde dehydrogenase n=1 Tax=Herbiconiux gentiana TaxID=2970912 RepID=A0ABT2GI90_9MICO|nr:bifunctional proline dehydrogenase/L-glutamate gamma-semialdehyde dehydrogenase [Herbiconiux gentiana]MCS5715946.1 bifunctional proline dehydrogenase/L-glutamate gamma-semialdehyde dehydrogenase [Herbiconiux gentiana]